MKIAMLAGTRPDIIKLSPIIKECVRRKIDYTLIYSNQHYSSSLSSVFFEELSIPEPNLFLDHLESSIESRKKIKEYLIRKKIDFFIIHGDTNTALTGVMASCQLNVKIVHVEAGLRSFDLSMIEEKNRIIIDHFSDILFTVSAIQKENLRKEGIDTLKIFEVGNTIVDVVKEYSSVARSKDIIRKTLEIIDREYFLLTLHRASNVDKKCDLLEIFNLIEKLPNKIIWPIHPRTLSRIEDFKLNMPSNVIPLEPLRYFDFLNLLDNAKSVITDSGGVQEEAYLLETPCLTIRSNTERPETLVGGANVLIGRNQRKLVQYLSREVDYSVGRLGDGETAPKILKILASYNKQLENRVV